MKLYLKNVLTAVFITAVCCFYVTAQNDDSSLQELFLYAEDSDEAIVSEEDDSSSISISSLTLPLKMSGSLSAELGGAYIRNDYINSASGYFDLKNYLYFNTRPDKYMAIKGALKTSMPSKDEAEKDNQNSYFYLYELYFDYLLDNGIAISAGKKKITWGNVRLFCRDEDARSSEQKPTDDDALYTNILYDSRYNISGVVSVPFGPAAISLVGMYNGITEEPSYKDMSFAGNLEIIIFNTSLSIFGRLFPSKEGNSKELHQLPIVGAEIKKSVFGFDIYGQGIARVESEETLRKFYDSHLYNRSSFDKFVFTGGFYRLWNENFPYFGINAEYQGIYYPVDKYYDEDKSKIKYEKGDMVHRVMVDFGLAKLGSNRNIKIGVQWFHNIFDKNGYIKPGVIVSNIFPHCDWRTGVQYEYGKEYDIGRFTFGTYLKFGLDY